MERPKRGIFIEDLETPLRVVLSKFIENFNSLYLDKDSDYMEHMEISFGLIKGDGAKVSINNNYHKRVEYQSDVLDNSWGAFPIRRLFNDLSGVCDEIIQAWSIARSENNPSCNSMNNRVRFELITNEEPLKENAKFLMDVLNSKELPNLKRVKMVGVTSNPTVFNNYFFSEQKFVHFKDMKEHNEYGANVLKILIKKGGLSFKEAYSSSVKEMLSHKEVRDILGSDTIELIYSDMAKGKKSDHALNLLYADLATFIDISNVKSKEFKSLHKKKTFGDLSSIVAIPTNYDTFFLSRIYIEEMFAFHSKKVANSNIIEKSTLDDFSYEKNVNFVFNMLTLKEFKPLTGLENVTVSRVNNMFVLVAETQENKYNRDKMLIEADALVRFLGDLTKTLPLSANGLLEDWIQGKSDKKFAGWQKNIIATRQQHINDFALIRKNKNKLDKVLGVQNDSLNHNEDSTSNSFKI